MSRFSFGFNPAFVAKNRYGTDPVRQPVLRLSLVSWTMLLAVTLAGGVAACILFGWPV